MIAPNGLIHFYGDVVMPVSHSTSVLIGYGDDVASIGPFQVRLQLRFFWLCCHTTTLYCYSPHAIACAFAHLSSSRCEAPKKIRSMRLGLKNVSWRVGGDRNDKPNRFVYFLLIWITGYTLSDGERVQPCVLRIKRSDKCYVRNECHTLFLFQQVLLHR